MKMFSVNMKLLLFFHRRKQYRNVIVKTTLKVDRLKISKLRVGRLRFGKIGFVSLGLTFSC